MKQLLLLIFTIITTELFTQNPVPVFGEISNAEINLTECEFDKSAEAVVLFDAGKSYFNKTESSFDLVFERLTRIKILSEAGIKYGDFEILFYQEGDIYEKVFEIEAYVYNVENGIAKRRKLDLNNIYEERLNKFWLRKKVALPNVKVGSIIEYTYKINSQYVFNLQDWQFQWKIPVKYSEYEVRMIPFYEYTFLLQGAEKFDKFTTIQDNSRPREFARVPFNDLVHTFVMKDIPSFKSEDYITSINDYIIKIDFQLARINHADGRKEDIITTWEEMNKDMLRHENFGDYIRSAEKVFPKLFEQLPSFTDDKDKFKFVMDYVKANFKWNNVNSKYSSMSIKKIVEVKYGNAADINLLAIGLMNAIGLDAKPVLISTRDHGKIKEDYPFIHFFDYVAILVEIDSLFILTDATSLSLMNDRVPSRCLNDKGLIIQKGQPGWVSLSSPYLSEIKKDFKISATENSLDVLMQISATEYDASYFRERLGSNKNDILKYLTDEGGYKVNMESIKVEHAAEIEKPYTFSCALEYNPEFINNKIYISPFLNEGMAESPFKENKRTYPIDFTYLKKRSFISTIAIPDGYSIDYLPPNKMISNDLIDFEYLVKNENQSLSISFMYNFKKSTYLATDYSKIKAYFDGIVAKGNDKVVLKKL